MSFYSLRGEKSENDNFRKLNFLGLPLLSSCQGQLSAQLCQISICGVAAWLWWPLPHWIHSCVSVHPPAANSTVKTFSEPFYNCFAVLFLYFSLKPHQL